MFIMSVLRIGVVLHRASGFVQVLEGILSANGIIYLTDEEESKRIQEPDSRRPKLSRERDLIL